MELREALAEIIHDLDKAEIVDMIYDNNLEGILSAYFWRELNDLEEN